MDSPLIEKLRKLLALADSDINQHEAELAMAKAQELALAHGIDIALVGTNPTSRIEDTITKETVNMGKRLPVVNIYVASILNEFFEVRMLTTGNRTYGRGIIFIGRRNAIDTAKYIYDWLSDTMVRCWKSYYDTTPGISLHHKQSYLLGFYRGLENKLRINKESVEAKHLHTEEDKNKYALVRVDLNNQIQQFVDDEFENIKNAPKQKVNIYNESYGQGYSEGGNCNIVKGGIAGQQSAAALT